MFLIIIFDWPHLLITPSMESHHEKSPEESPMTRIRQTLHHHRHTLMKTASYYVIHVTVAAAVAYAVTRNLWAALTLSLLEPTVQAVAFFFHEKLWERGLRRRADAAAAMAPPTAAA
jgi:uncharacterized membrane protein